MSHREIAERFIGNVVQASSPAVSPDGTAVAFVVSRTDLTANEGRSQIWHAPTDGSRPPAVLTGGEHDSSPTWSPDGASLAFVSARGETAGAATLHVLPMGHGGELRTIATMADGISNVRFSPDGRRLAFISRTQHERYTAKDERWQAPRKIDRFFSRLDNEGWIVDRPSHVYVVDVDGTSSPRNLTPGEFQHSDVSWLPDGAGIVTAAQRHDTWDLDFANDLYLIRLDGTVTALTSQTGVCSAPSVADDGERVAFIGADDPSTYPQNMHIGVAHVEGGHRFVSTALDRTFETTVGSRPPVWETADTLLATADDRGTTHLYRVHVDGTAPVAVTHGPITVRGFDTRSGVTVVAIGSVDGVADLAVVQGDTLVRLTDFAQRFRVATTPRSWQRLEVPTTDGTDVIDAWVMLPAADATDAKRPVLLNVHGGPHTQYGETFFDEAQMQAAAGFVVVMCNPRGSSGRHEGWGQAILGPKHPSRPGTGWGSVDVDDVLAVIDHVLATVPQCDADRVGMLGGSYGGFMATWLAAKHGGRFRAICSERSVNNMLSEEWNSDIGSIFRVEIGPNHLEDPDYYTATSPITFVRDIDVPMLLVHSENDLRCPIGQAEELFMALRLLGKDVTFYRFPGEGHELSRSGSPIHRVQRAEILLDWFTERLAPR